MARVGLLIIGAFLALVLPSARFAGAQQEWQKVVAGAKNEGRVVVVGPSIRRLSQGLVDGFKKAHGIDVEYLGLGFKAVTRLEREQAAGRISIDVYLGGLRTILIFMEKDLAEPIADKLLLPEVRDPSKWKGGKLKWVDAKGRYGLQTTEYVMTDLFVNKDHVDPSKITSWKDLLKPEWKGKIGSYDPRHGGAGQAVARYLVDLFGDEFIVQLYKGQQVAFTRDHRQVAEWAARGTYPIVLGGVQVMIEQFKKEGFPLVRVFPKDGPGSVLGGFSTVAMVKGAPNPNAAITFVNWFASKQGQELYVPIMLEPSRRVDVSTGLVPDYVVPQPGISYDIDQYTEDFQTNIAPKLEKRLLNALGR